MLIVLIDIWSSVNCIKWHDMASIQRYFKGHRLNPWENSKYIDKTIQLYIFDLPKSVTKCRIFTANMISHWISFPCDKQWYISCCRGCTVNRSGPKLGQNGPKWGKSEDFSHQIQYILALWSSFLFRLFFFFPSLFPFFCFFCQNFQVNRAQIGSSEG